MEPYIQDDFHVNSKLTLNLGLRWSLFGTYYEKYNREYNFSTNTWTPANAPLLDPNTTGVAQSSHQCPAFLLQSGRQSVSISTASSNAAAPAFPADVSHNHWVNPAPRVGFAFDPKGDGKTAIRGGYGIFFDHGNGNEANAESLEGSAPLVLTPNQSNIAGNSCGQTTGYTCLGTAGGAYTFPLSVTSIPNNAIWPYMQQWNISIQHEFAKNIVGSIAYVGSKGTNLADQRDLNQLVPTAAGQNPYTPGVPLSNPATAIQRCCQWDRT